MILGIVSRDNVVTALASMASDVNSLIVLRSDAFIVAFASEMTIV